MLRPKLALLAVMVGSLSPPQPFMWPLRVHPPSVGILSSWPLSKVATVRSLITGWFPKGKYQPYFGNRPEQRSLLPLSPSAKMDLAIPPSRKRAASPHGRSARPATARVGPTTEAVRGRAGGGLKVMSGASTVSGWGSGRPAALG